LGPFWSGRSFQDVPDDAEGCFFFGLDCGYSGDATTVNHPGYCRALLIYEEEGDRLGAEVEE
jgi:hypothetical protein